MGRAVKKKKLHWQTHLIFGSWLLVLAYLVTGHSLPHTFYVQDSVTSIDDVCVGSDELFYRATRTPRWGMLGDTYAQVVKFENQNITETTITRGTVKQPVTWGYEANTTSANYLTKWEEVFEVPGEYGVNSWNTIYPLPFISVSWFEDGRDNRFNVISCDF